MASLQRITSLGDFLRSPIFNQEAYRSFSTKWAYFFQTAPLLLLSLSFLIGIALATEMCLATSLVAALLLIFSAKNKGAWVLLLFLTLGALYVTTLIKTPPKSTPALSGTALFCPESITPSLDSGKNTVAFRGTLQYFVNSEGQLVAKNVPCAFSVKNFKGPLPSPDSDWIIQGILQEGRSRFWKFKPAPEVFWKEESKIFSWNKLRVKLKEHVKNFIQKNVLGDKNQNLIVGMVTGSFSDQEIAQGFQRFGLQHILAISGFHFSLFALIAKILIKPFFKGKTLPVLLALSVTSYFIFLGPTPSVQRAWAMIALSLTAAFFERRISPFNALGAALFLTLLYDPLSFKSPGFVLSFAITFSILAFAKTSGEMLDTLFPERTFKEASEMRTIDKMGFIAFTTFKRMTALNLAVHVTAIPLTLALFGSFPLLSILFNLFFPTLAGLVIFLFIISALLYLFIEPIGTYLFSLTSKATEVLLSFALDMPASWNIQLLLPLATDWAILIAFALFVVAVLVSQKSEDLYNERPIF